MEDLVVLSTLLSSVNPEENEAFLNKLKDDIDMLKKTISVQNKKLKEETIRVHESSSIIMTLVNSLPSLLD